MYAPNSIHREMYFLGPGIIPDNPLFTYKVAEEWSGMKTRGERGRACFLPLESCWSYLRPLIKRFKNFRRNLCFILPNINTSIISNLLFNAYQLIRSTRLNLINYLFICIKLRIHFNNQRTWIQSRTTSSDYFLNITFWTKALNSTIFEATTLNIWFYDSNMVHELFICKIIVNNFRTNLWKYLYCNRNITFLSKQFAN